MNILDDLCKVNVLPDDDFLLDDDEPMAPTGADEGPVAGPGALEATWWLSKDETGDMAAIMERAGKSLDKMFEEFKIAPLEIDNEKVLFEARYEFQTYEKDLQHPDGKIEGAEECLGFIDFMTGFPMKNTELMLTMGQYSSRKDKNSVISDPESPVPPMPDDLFEGVEPERLLLNYLYLDEDQVNTLADDLKGEEEPKGLHWWVRLNLKGESKWPVPGEFMGLANRSWVTLPWGDQKTSPYLFSGNWMDTVFYTTGVITEIIEPDDLHPWKRYKVRWRTTGNYPEGIVELTPSDFAEYRVGDQVAIIKQGSVEKETQQWKDEDTKEIDPGKSMIAPIIFYGIKGTGQEAS